jgi:plasmid maintenance system antidote protein VapI
MDKRRVTSGLGDALYGAIRRSGLTRAELSRRSGVAYSVVHRFCERERDLTLRVASRLAEAVGLELRPIKRRRRQARKDGDR